MQWPPKRYTWMATQTIESSYPFALSVRWVSFTVVSRCVWADSCVPSIFILAMFSIVAIVYGVQVGVVVVTLMVRCKDAALQCAGCWSNLNLHKDKWCW